VIADGQQPLLDDLRGKAVGGRARLGVPGVVQGGLDGLPGLGREVGVGLEAVLVGGPGRVDVALVEGGGHGGPVLGGARGLGRGGGDPGQGHGQEGERGGQGDEGGTSAHLGAPKPRGY